MSYAFRTVGVIGDVHCEDEVLELVLAFFDARGVDAVLCVGDVVDGTGDVDRCCRLLREHDVACVAGNHDRWLFSGLNQSFDDASRVDELSDASRDWLASLPRTQRFETVAGPLLLCHGLGENDMGAVNPDDEGYALEVNGDLHALVASPLRFVANGHTHRRMVRTFAMRSDGSALTILNAGTLHRKSQQGCLLASFDDSVARFFDVSGGSVVEAETQPIPRRGSLHVADQSGRSE